MQVVRTSFPRSRALEPFLTKTRYSSKNNSYHLTAQRLPKPQPQLAARTIETASSTLISPLWVARKPRPTQLHPLRAQIPNNPRDITSLQIDRGLCCLSSLVSRKSDHSSSASILSSLPLTARACGLWRAATAQLGAPSPFSLHDYIRQRPFSQPARPHEYTFDEFHCDDCTGPCDRCDIVKKDDQQWQ